MNRWNSMFNIYENERYLIKSCLDLAVIIVCFLFIYITYLLLKNIGYLNTNILLRIVIALAITCTFLRVISEEKVILSNDWFDAFSDKLSIEILNIFRYIKPYNRKTFNHLYLNQEIDIDFIVNKIIPLSVYKDNEKIMNHITVDQMLNMRRDFDESA